MNMRSSRKEEKPIRLVHDLYINLKGSPWFLRKVGLIAGSMYKYISLSDRVTNNASYAVTLRMQMLTDRKST